MSGKYTGLQGSFAAQIQAFVDQTEEIDFVQLDGARSHCSTDKKN